MISDRWQFQSRDSQEAFRTDEEICLGRSNLCLEKMVGKVSTVFVLFTVLITIPITVRRTSRIPRVRNREAFGSH